jgi:hypothetical protein
MASYWTILSYMLLPSLVFLVFVVKSQKRWQFLFQGRDIMMKMAAKVSDTASTL